MKALTGIQPSGVAHLGNLFGSMLPILDFTKKYTDCAVMIVDLHALTTVSDKETLRKNTLALAADLLALGLNPEKSIFFSQSRVSAHTELAWILSTIAPMGLLNRAHSFKEKTARGFDASVGLFTYPILMAADILLYDAERVPVGKDQKQHLEIARDIAQKFNTIFGETFLLPKPDISENVAVVPGTDGQKMSKSYGNTIEIFAPEKILKKQIMSIQTDSKTVAEKKEPEGNTLFELYRLFATKEEIGEMAKKFRGGNFGYGDAKNILFEKANTFLKPLRKQREEIIARPSEMNKILKMGAEKANQLAQKKLEKVKKKVGLL